MPTDSSAQQDQAILRELAKRYLELCHQPVQRERRALWRRLHALEPVRPLIYVRACAWREMPQAQCQCADPFYKRYEDFFRRMLFQDTFNDDYIFEPWVTVRATLERNPEGVWGVAVPCQEPEESTGARHWDPPLKNPEDLEKLKVTHHRVDETATAQDVEKLQRALGDILTINVDRGPVYGMWDMDLSTNLGYLRGIEPLMWDMMDRPEWLHKLLAFMRDGILQCQQEAEAAGDWRLCNHQNQSMPYAAQLADPQANSAPAAREKLWCFCASQELTTVGPAQFDEFMLQYQIPIIEKFGLAAYGCCEDLTLKIPLLRRIRNLRRIAVAPAAKVAKCVEQIGQDYVISYRPSPADMVSYDFNPERVREILTRDLSLCRECRLDITLKDVETVEGDPQRIQKWVALARQVIQEVGWK